MDNSHPDVAAPPLQRTQPRMTRMQFKNVTKYEYINKGLLGLKLTPRLRSQWMNSLAIERLRRQETPAYE